MQILKIIKIIATLFIKKLTVLKTFEKIQSKCIELCHKLLKVDEYIEYILLLEFESVKRITITITHI